MNKIKLSLKKDKLNYQVLYIDDVAIDEFRFNYVEMEFYNSISGEWQEKVTKVVSTAFNEETELLLIKLDIMQAFEDLEDRTEQTKVYEKLEKDLKKGIDLTIIK